MESDVDADAPAAVPDPAALPAADGMVERAAELLRGAERPVVMAGTGLYWAHGEDGAAGALRASCRFRCSSTAWRAAACRPTTRMFFSRARGTALKGADVALVIGVPMDFRLGFGGSFGEDTQIVVIGSAPPERPHPREVAAELYGGVARDARRAARRAAPAAGPLGLGRVTLRAAEDEKRAAEQAELSDERAPLHPMRVYDELGAGAGPQRDRDRRRRRLRLLRRAHDRDLRAGLLDGPGPVRLPRRRAGLRAGGEAREPRPPGLPAARRRRLRLRGNGVRHARAPRRAGRRR